MSVTPDRAKAESLVDTAKARIEFLKSNALTEQNARFIFEGYYSSAIEMIHALVITQGFKVDNHICLGFYLRDVLNNERLFRIFDDYRYKRNSVVYYGKELDFEVAKESIRKITELINEVDKLK